MAPVELGHPSQSQPKEPAEDEPAKAAKPVKTQFQSLLSDTALQVRSIVSQDNCWHQCSILFKKEGNGIVEKSSMPGNLLPGMSSCRLLIFQIESDFTHAAVHSCSLVYI